MSQFCQSTGKIAVWNLAGYQRISAARLQNQVDGLALLDAELVTLVEVKPRSHIDDLIAGLAAKGVHCEAKILQQNSDLNIGILHKTGVSVQNLRFVPGSDLGNPDYRQAIVADVQIGSFRAVLIGVHLKSSRGGNFQAIRDAQCKVIGDFIADLRQTAGLKRRTILLMGDFNMIPGQDVSNFHHLGGEDLMDFVSCWDLQERFSHILEQGRANLLDGFAVSRTYSTRYIRGSLRLFPMHWTMDMGREKFRETVSDHLPFVASFRIT